MFKMHVKTGDLSNNHNETLVRASRSAASQPLGGPSGREQALEEQRPAAFQGVSSRWGQRHRRGKAMICRGAILALSAIVAVTSMARAARYEQDPFARIEAAKAEAARNPMGEPHIRRAMEMRHELGLSADDVFVLINASTDDEGGTHARLQQFHQGVPVRGGELLSHADARGNFLAYGGRVQKDIRIDTRPRLSATAALAVAARQPSHKFEYSWEPRAELSIQTNYVRVDTHSGKPMEQSEADIDHTAPAALSDPINAADTVRQVSGHTLVWTVRTVEGREGFDEELNEVVYTIDAQTGQVLRETSAGQTVTGTGSGKFNKKVSFETIVSLSSAGVGFFAWDSLRNFETLDNDFAWGNGSNFDADNLWGDGQPFMGDNGPLANRQSAIVDGHFGETVYWDMMANVFKHKGFDGNKIGLTVFVHIGWGWPQVGLVWDNADYSPNTGNIRLGDGPTRQALDCLGHESGHGFAYHTVNFGGNMGAAINESQADIWGAMTTFYLGGNGFATQLSRIPASGGSFVQQCSGRNMMKPTLGTGKDKSDFWNTDLENWPDEHDRGQPNNRAFFFLAQGASPFMKDNNYSFLLPWGMTGIGNDKAARLWFRAMHDHHMMSDPDYVDVKAALVSAAILNPNIFDPVSTIAALNNAYAGINVGSLNPGYPPEPALQASNGSNNTPQTAQDITLPTIAIGASKPGKVKFFGSGDKTLFYQVNLPPSASATVRIYSPFDNWDLGVIDDFGVVVSSANGQGEFDLVTVTAGSGLNNQGQSFLIAVKPFWLKFGTGTFVMDIDRF
jgi:Zn-dependent metalloprotease